MRDLSKALSAGVSGLCGFSGENDTIPSPVEKKTTELDKIIHSQRFPGADFSGPFCRATSLIIGDFSAELYASAEE